MVPGLEPQGQCRDESDVQSGEADEARVAPLAQIRHTLPRAAAASPGLLSLSLIRR